MAIRMHRRTFLRVGVGAGALAGAAPASAAEPNEPYQIGVFTKFLQHLSYQELAETISELGFDGIEAPVRPRGHIEPGQVEDELPAMVEALAERDLEILVMASGINQVNREQRTEAVLRTAAALGVKRYRMAYYKYDLARPIRAQLDEFRPQLADLAALNKELGIQAVYQNHSGKNYCGGPVWDIYGLIREHDPQHAALAFDIGHATVEGGFSWAIDFALARSHLGMIYVKDFRWEGRKRVGVPLGQGNVSPEFFRMVRALPEVPPISLHVEYLPKQSPSAESVEIHTAAMAENLATLRSLLAGG